MESLSAMRAADERRRTAVGLGLLVLLALLVRLPRVGESLWYDEVAAWRDYGIRGVRAALAEWHDPANHVLQTALTAMSVPALGGLLGAEAAMRLPALLASLLVPLGMFALGRRTGSDRVAWYAALLGAVLPVAALSGVEARGYAFMLAAAAFATALFDRVLAGGDRRALPLYAAVVALGTWAHFVTACIAVGHAVAALGLAAGTRDPRLARRGLAAVAAAGALSALVLAPVLDDVLRLRGTFGASGADQPGLLGSEGLHALLQLGGAWSWWGALPAGGLAVIGVVSLLARRADAAPRRVALLALAGLVVAVALVLALGTWIYARFLLFAVPGAVLLSAIGLARIRALAQPAVPFVLVAVLGAWLVDVESRPPKQPLRDAAALVRAERAPDDALLVVGLRHQVMDVYAADLDPAYALFHGRDLAEGLAAHEPSWPDWAIVLYPRHVGAARRALLAERGLALHATLPGWADWGEGAVEVWRRTGASERR